MKKNILFLLKSFEIGGLEVVTAVLANKFVCEGHSVSIFAFEPAKKSSIEDRLDKRIKVCTGHNQKYSKEHVQTMRSLMLEQQVQIVINQWGLPMYLLRTAVHAAKGMNMKFISVYHSAPNKNGRIQGIDNALKASHNIFKTACLHVLRGAFEAVTAYSMRWNYKHSDYFMVLSPSYIKVFEEFVGIHPAKKLIVQTNPITIDTRSFSFDQQKKQKEIIFVGRLDPTLKKVKRIIDIWNLLASSNPDWRLTIIGDGPDRSFLENYVQELNLKRVSFEGFQNPVEYYKRASILMLTSDFEGFPLVLPECMSCGVIPAVYGSFSAVYDIVEDGKNGIVIPFNKDGFDAKQMADRITELMRNENIAKRMRENAVLTSKNFTVNHVYLSWLNCFNRLMSNEEV